MTGSARTCRPPAAPTRRMCAIPGLELTTRTLHAAMSRWFSRSIHHRLLPILRHFASRGATVGLQDLLLRLTFDNICGLTFGKDLETLSPGLSDNAFANSFDRATEATLQRFIFPEFVWPLKKWFRTGSEVARSDSVTHVERYLSAVIKNRKLELGANGGHHDDLLSRFMKKGTYSSSFLQSVAPNFILARVVLPPAVHHRDQFLSHALATVQRDPGGGVGKGGRTGATVAGGAGDEDASLGGSEGTM